jgi:hypothetical protein
MAAATSRLHFLDDFVSSASTRCSLALGTNAEGRRIIPHVSKMASEKSAALANQEAAVRR